MIELHENSGLRIAKAIQRRDGEVDTLAGQPPEGITQSVPRAVVTYSGQRKSTGGA